MQVEPPRSALLALVSILFAISTSLAQTATLMGLGTEPDKSVVNTDGTPDAVCCIRGRADTGEFAVVARASSRTGLPTKIWALLRLSSARSAETPDRLPAVHPCFTADFDFPIVRMPDRHSTSR